MRIVVTVGMLLVLGFAGCIDDGGLETDSEADPQAQYKAKDPRTNMPENRRFEPKLIFDTKVFEIEQGDNIEFIFDVTDMEDYPYPVTFIDWNVTYNREPNPVAEGDATVLPGTWNRTLFAEDYHLFRFNVDDGQGFKANQTIIIKVGDPPEITGDIEEALDNAPTGDGGAVFEPMTIDETIAFQGTCSPACSFASAYPTFSSGNGMTYMTCPGMSLYRNGAGCAWVEIPPGAVGSAFTVTATSASPATGADPDVAALDACRPNARVIQTFGAFGGESGAIPAGTRCLVAWSFDEPSGSITFHVDEFQHAVSGHIPWDYPALEGGITTPPVTGCQSDVRFTCQGFMAGPYASMHQGWWVPLDLRHEGATVDTDILLADARAGLVDTDCYFLDHMLNVVGSAHGGLGPCSGEVPANAWWMYIFPYAAGDTLPGLYIDITLNAEKAAAAEAAGQPVGATLMADYEDKGSYWQHVTTGVCYFTGSYTAIVPGFHYVAFGTWFFQETNGIPGFQVNDETGTTESAAIGSAVSGSGCVGGDATVL